MQEIVVFQQNKSGPPGEVGVSIPRLRLKALRNSPWLVASLLFSLATLLSTATASAGPVPWDNEPTPAAVPAPGEWMTISEVDGLGLDADEASAGSSAAITPLNDSGTSLLEDNAVIDPDRVVPRLGMRLHNDEDSREAAVVPLPPPVYAAIATGVIAIGMRARAKARRERRIRGFGGR